MKENQRDECSDSKFPVLDQERAPRESERFCLKELKPQARPQHVVLALWQRTGCGMEIVPLQDSLGTLGRQDRLAGGMGIPFRCFFAGSRG